MSEPSSFDPAEAKPRVFVSYGRADAKEIAERLCVDLAANGYAVWQDAREIRAGDAWHRTIEEGLRSCQLVVALLSPHSVRRGRAGEDYSVCLDEWSFAQSELRRPIVPVLVRRGAEPPPLFLHRLDYVDLTRWIDSEEQYQAGLARLLKALEESRQGIVRYRSWDRTLQPWDFSAFLHDKRRGFTGREWLFDEIEAWRSASAGERILLIKGDPGAGKSALLAELAHRSPHVAAHHCCQADVQATLDPGRFVRSVAAMLASRFDDYALQFDDAAVQEALGDATAATDPIAAFDAGVLAPLERLSPDAPVYLLVDALDEALARRDGSLTIVDLLAARRDRLPGWLRVIATTRDEPSVLDRLAGLRARAIDAQDPRNLDDVAAYVRMRLAQPNLAERLVQSGISESEAASALEKRSGGNFLYARQALDAIERDECRFDDLSDLPPGLFGLYRAFFARQFPLRRNEEGEEVASGYERPKRVLESLLAAEEPLDEEQLAAATELDRDEELPRALRRLTGYVPERPDAKGRMRFSFFHKSLPEWLMGRDLRGGPYAVAPRRGHRRLADSGWSEYDRAAACEDSFESVARLSDYVLRHLPRHLAAAERWEDLERLMTDLAYLEAKVRRGLAFDLPGDFAQSVAALPIDRPQRRILALLEEAIRHDVNFIARHAEDYPQGLFQCLWNSCWWYDCPEAYKHYEPPAAGWPNDSRVSPRVGDELSSLMERWRASKERMTPGFYWIRSLRAPVIPLGGGQLGVLSGHANGVTGVAFSPDGSQIASSSYDGTVRIWQAHTGAVLAVLRGHEASVTCLGFSPDAKLLVSGGGELPGNWSLLDATIRVWDARAGSMLAALRGHEEPVTQVAFSPDGLRIVSATYEGTIRFWDARSGELLTEYTPDVYLNGIAYSPSGDRVALALGDKTIRIWDTSAGTELAFLRGHEEGVNCVSYSPDGRWLVSGSGGDPSCLDYDNTVRVWDSQSGSEFTVMRGHRREIRSVCFSPDSQNVASVACDGTVRIWQVRDGVELAVFRGHSETITCVAYSPDGSRIASGSADGDNAIRLWDATARGETPQLRGHDGAVYCLAYSPDGRRIASGGSDGTVRIWDSQAGLELRTFRVTDSTVRCLAFSPSGQSIVIGIEDDQAQVWDIEVGTQIVNLCGEEGRIWDVAFVADGNRIATVHRHITSSKNEAIVCVWDAQTYDRLQAFPDYSNIAGYLGESEKPFQVMQQENVETCVRDLSRDEILGYFPSALYGIVAHPLGRQWAGCASGSHFICALEEAPAMSFSREHVR